MLASAAYAQKHGGILRVYQRDSPMNMSILEETSISVDFPAMPMFNNLVVFDPKQKQNSLKSIIPELADSWSWDDAGTALTFKLHSGVKWHDGVPFTSADVKCTWDLLLNKTKEKLRINAHQSWWTNVDEVITDGDQRVTFHLKRPQPALLAFFAAGQSPVYPCHVSPAQMRQHPIGTGPFKFVDYKPNQAITLARNPHYWKPGKPYLDGIELTVMPNRATAILGFVSGQLDMTFPNEVTIPLLGDIKKQRPTAVCEIAPTHDAPNVLISHTPPFDKPEMRRAIALTIDRQAFIDILGNGQGDIGTAMLPGPEGNWAMPKEMMQKLPGYDPDVAKSRAEARDLMQKLGYGPDHHLQVHISAKNIPSNRDPGELLIDQLKQIWIDADMQLVETALWLSTLVRGNYVLAIELVGDALDDPDQTFFEGYACNSNMNHAKYCNPKVDEMISQQSMEPDQEKRRKMVWAIDSQIQQDVGRPMIWHERKATCWQPEVKGLNLFVNSQYNGWRMEDVWLDR
jgi:peptide/nickel transport system substrate-binding protein